MTNRFPAFPTPVLGDDVQASRPAVSVSLTRGPA